MKIDLELLSDANRQEVLKIDRSDISLDYVEDISETLRQSDYGDEHHLRGHGYVIRCDGACAGVMLIGEGIPWDCDPEEIQGTFFYRILGFVLDKRFRGRGWAQPPWSRPFKIFMKSSALRPSSLSVTTKMSKPLPFMKDTDSVIPILQRILISILYGM